MSGSDKTQVCESCGLWTDGLGNDTEARDVMRELAEALREWVPCDCMWCSNPEYRGPCAESRAANAALAKYDRMTGGDA